jgi:hypothetical protein
MRHAALLRGDQALHALLGIKRFPIADTIRNLFRAFSMGNLQRLLEPLAEWQMRRLPLRPEGYTLDLDSTVFERYGKQEGSRKGHNPRQHGRPTHHPLLAVLSEAHFLVCESFFPAGLPQLDTAFLGFFVLIFNHIDFGSVAWFERA